MFNFRLPYTLLVILLVGGCSTIVSGKFQNIYIDTECAGVPIPLTCSLKNENGTWSVTAPGGVVVQKGYGDLAISCTGSLMPQHEMRVRSSAELSTYGNALGLNFLGAYVDVTTGAGYGYPSKVNFKVSSCDVGKGSAQINRWWR